MSCHRNATGFVNRAIGIQHIGGGSGSGITTCQHFRRHIQTEQQMLNVINRCFRRENPQNMKAKRGGELEAGQHENLI